MAEVESTEPSDSGTDKKKEDESVPGRVFSRDAPPILHLLVIGFHHKKGYITMTIYFYFLISLFHQCIH